MSIDSSEQAELFSFLRRLVDLDSTTGREAAVAEAVAAELRRDGRFEVELWEAEPRRPNVFARRGRPAIVFSTHLDTVPPFFPSREDDEWIHGRGACDAKGILAAQLFAARRLAAAGESGFGLLFLVGEEKNSTGALAANLRPQGTRFLVNGEPTESRMITAGKGALRVNLRARGRAAHSAYPQLGESAIVKLLAALERLGRLDLPRDPVLGPTTWNIGTIAGGHAPNVVADTASAELLYRLVAPAAALRRQIEAACQPDAEAEFSLEVPPVKLLALKDFATDIAAFTTDIPSLGAWGEPLLFGPGSIHLAHTREERIAKAELSAAVATYARIFYALRARLDSPAAP